MPISPSPIVQGYMAGVDQSSTEPMSADQMFEKRFSDSAFNMLKSKFSNVVSRVVTFRILESDVEKGTGLGCFIVQSGKDVRYIPVVMSDGAIVSCEFLYNKDADQFTAMTPESVQSMVMQNMLHSGEIMSGSAHVENTQDLFRNLIRPPASSNVVMASVRDFISELPNSAKEKVAAWLNDNPDIVSKIASVYDIEELGNKLAVREEKVAEEPPCTVVHDLSKVAMDIVSTLTEQESSLLIKDGYLVKRAEESTAIVATKEDFSDTLKSSIGFELVSGDSKDSTVNSSIRVGKAVCLRASGLEYIDTLFIGNIGLFKDGSYVDLSYEGTPGIVVKGLSSAVDKDMLVSFGAKKPKDMLTNDTSQVLVCTPAKAGRYKNITDKVGISYWGKVQGSIIDGDVYLGAYAKEVHATSKLSTGYIHTENTIHVPLDTLFIPLDYEKENVPHGLARSLDDVLAWVAQKGTQVTVVDDDISTDITDGNTKKTAHFFSKAAAAEYLATAYGLDHAQTSEVLGNRHSYVFNKVAFGPQVQVDPNTGMQLPMDPNVMGQMGMPQQVQSNGAPQQPMFDPAPMQTVANIGDPDLMDTGILASFSQDPDIKVLLVDYIPNFIDTVDKLARVIILLSINKKDTEEFYGRDRYATLISNCRKMVKLTSDIIESLQRYVRMS